jgi:predicted transcriptional regulator
MDAARRRRLEAAGWRFGNYADFLGLTPAEVGHIEIHFSLGHAVRAWRQRLSLTQVELATRLESSQSRVAKMEAGDPKVSIDLLLRALLTLGATRKQIARVIAG